MSILKHIDYNRVETLTDTKGSWGYPQEPSMICKSFMVIPNVLYWTCHNCGHPNGLGFYSLVGNGHISPAVVCSKCYTIAWVTLKDFDQAEHNKRLNDHAESKTLRPFEVDDND